MPPVCRHASHVSSPAPRRVASAAGALGAVNFARWGACTTCCPAATAAFYLRHCAARSQAVGRGVWKRQLKERAFSPTYKPDRPRGVGWQRCTMGGDGSARSGRSAYGRRAANATWLPLPRRRCAGQKIPLPGGPGRAHQGWSSGPTGRPGGTSRRFPSLDRNRRPVEIPRRTHPSLARGARLALLLLTGDSATDRRDRSEPPGAPPPTARPPSADLPPELPQRAHAANSPAPACTAKAGKTLRASTTHAEWPAAASTAAIGYWTEGDSIPHSDFDTQPCLRDVAGLAAKIRRAHKICRPGRTGTPGSWVGLARSDCQTPRRWGCTEPRRHWAAVIADEARRHCSPCAPTRYDRCTRRPDRRSHHGSRGEPWPDQRPQFATPGIPAWRGSQITRILIDYASRRFNLPAEGAGCDRCKTSLYAGDEVRRLLRT